MERYEINAPYKSIHSQDTLAHLELSKLLTSSHGILFNVFPAYTDIF